MPVRERGVVFERLGCRDQVPRDPLRVLLGEGLQLRASSGVEILRRDALGDGRIVVPRADGELCRAVPGLPRSPLAIRGTLRRATSDPAVRTVLARTAGPVRAALVATGAVVARTVPALTGAARRVLPIASAIITRTVLPLTTPIVTRTIRTLTTTVITRTVLPLTTPIVTRTIRTLTIAATFGPASAGSVPLS